ncbi:MFS transporter [Emticicia sp. BO119]|uniref:MFS transporter n=1 Tax=Emticicia sp. BO119 TaxID=2757768 RepID=UPI0015F1036B|nr:MFS transporter [Emticicia sp. BO119]MBA4849650.1 MFS transporter [Emticicia sp. BO119]
MTSSLISDLSTQKKLRKARISTLFIFLVCGIGLATWVPMVPLAKIRLQLNDAALGLILLCLGAGAMTIMPFTGSIINRFGSRKVMLIAGLMIALILPLLLFADTSITLSVSLYLFGIAIGAIDVSMNAQAVIIQERVGKYIMSSFHGLFSVGGLIGSLGLGFFFGLGLSSTVAVFSISALLIFISLSQYRNLLPHSEEKKVNTSTLTIPKGRVLILGLMCFVAFLAEGAILDWSAVFLQFHRNFTQSTSGIGFAAFSVAMSVMRLSGDKIINSFSSQKVVLYGGLLAAAGILLAILIPYGIATIIGFVLVGVGCANIVPVFFSSAGNLPDMSPSAAIAGVTTLGYIGQLAGPAFLGFVAELTSLSVALGSVSVLLVIVAFSFRR